MRALRASWNGSFDHARWLRPRVLHDEHPSSCLRFVRTRVEECIWELLCRVALLVFVEKRRTVLLHEALETMAEAANPVSPGTFLTAVQPAPFDDYATDDVGELEALVAGVTQTTQSTLLLKKRKEMREVDDALEFMKDEFRKRMEACDDRQREFEKKQRGMKEQVTRFEKFIQENDAKRKRAEKKALDEKNKGEKLEISKVEWLDKLETVRRDTKVMQEKLGRLLRYQAFLQTIVDRSLGDNDYNEISDIVNRYRTLRLANEDLQGSQLEAEKKVDEERANNSSELTKTQNSILVQNSDIHAKQNEIESLKQSNADLDATIEENAKRSASSKKDSGLVIMSIKNLLNRCGTATTRKTKPKIPKIEANETEDRVKFLDECLGHVEVRIVELSEIHEQFKLRSKEESKSESKRGEGGLAESSVNQPEDA